MTDTYDIIYHPDPVLKQVANPIDSIDQDIQFQAKKMLDTVITAGNSVGLAANQVGILNRMMVCEINPGGWLYDNPDAHKPEIIGSGGDRRGNPILMINPEIVKTSERHSICMEGCMSLPEQFARVERPCDITVEYINLNGDKQSIDASGFDAHVVQHELDHLNGVLFIDYLSRLKRGMLVKKLEKWKKMEGLL
jgi:peptide deformylase